jgi:ATP adenylyltransferase
MTSAWERLWAPHRIEYIRAGAEPHEVDCPFCRAPQLDDEAGLVVFRGTDAFVVMNLYPYNTGHVLVCPYRHFGDYPDATPAETMEIAELTQQAMRVIRAVSGAHGFNIGLNQGSLAGAGIAGHLHQHVVPRWSGDANFMPVVGQTKVMPQLLEETRQLLVGEWNRAG